MEPRFVIVNADDFGLTNDINRGIIEAHESGIVTSASLMVRYEAATDAADYARANSRLSVGLHFELSEWRYAEGEWKLAYCVANADDAAEVRVEFERQLTAFARLMGRTPTHLDSHQHVHLSEPARTILLEQADRLGVPLRSCTPAIRHQGSFYGQTAEGAPYPEGLAPAHMSRLLADLNPGWTEIGCHPGYTSNLDSVYLSERETEIRVLCSSEVGRALKESNVKLRSFQGYLDAKKMVPPQGAP